MADSGDLLATLLADTEREIDAIASLPAHKRFARMVLLSLEREQVAAVAYSEELVASRLAALPVDPEVKELVSRVVKWTQRDEALHAQYMRGVLLQAGEPLPIGFVLARQAVGTVSGWVSAISHHDDSERWGIRRASVKAAIAAGKAIGRVPDGLADELTYRSFRQFCELSVALEESAVLSYERMLDLLDDDEHIETFSRILDDERRHSAVFSVLASSFTEDDRLADSVTVDDLAERIGAVSPWFLPARHRATTPLTAFGRGSRVHVERGDEGELASTMEQVVRAAGLEEIVRANPGPVAVRGQFMLGYHRDDRSTIVHPEAVEVLARLLRSWGATDVAVIETPMAYDRFFANRSVAEVAEYFGFDSPLYRIVDVSEDARSIGFERGLVSSGISATWADASVRIVLSKLKGDPVELAHLSLASLGGIGGRTDEHLYTDRLVDHRSALLMALDVAPPHFAIVDAWAPVADGPLGVMGCDDPADVRRFYAGADAVSVDAAVFADMGFDDSRRSEIHRQADQWFGSMATAVDVEGSPGPFEGFRTPQDTWWFRLVSALAAPVYLNLSLRGALFVPEMDTAAFPPIDSPSWFVRSVRRASQRVFGLRPPNARLA